MRGRTGLGALVLSALACATVGQTASSGEDAAASLTRQPGADSTSPDRTELPAPPPDLPEAVVVRASASLGSPGWALGVAGGSAALDLLPGDLLGAYSVAVAVAPVSCHVTTSVLAAIGQVESGNLAGRRTDARHRVRPAVVGPVLDGAPYAAVRDTDGGRWDGDATWDRAVGPMQLLPATWRVVAVDMDGDGVRDPQDVYDAAGAAMVYLCAGGRDLGTAAGLRRAVLSYNHSGAYLDAVLGWKAVFDRAPAGFVPTVWTPPVATQARAQALVRPVLPTHAGIPPVPPVPSVPGLLDPADPSSTVPLTPTPTTGSPAVLDVAPTEGPTVGPGTGPAPTPTPTSAPTTTTATTVSGAPSGAPNGASPGPGAVPTPSSVPVPSGSTDPTTASPATTSPNPDPATPVPGTPEPWPVCALPAGPGSTTQPAPSAVTPSPTPAAAESVTSQAGSQTDAQAAGPAGAPVTSPSTSPSASGATPGDPCVPPVGYELDPVSGELVPVAPTTP